MNFREQYNKLVNDINNSFKKLNKNLKNYDFIEVIQDLDSTNEDDRIKELFEMGEMGENVPTVSRRLPLSGEDTECYIISVLNNTICAIDKNDEEDFKIISFNDLSSVIDKMDLIDAMLELK